MIYNSDSFSGKGGYVWRPDGLARYKRWRNKYQQPESSCVQVSVDAGIDCLTRASLASAQEWDGGSRPFFWRRGESIGKKPEMEPKFGSVLTSRRVRRSSECQRILLFERRSRKRLTKCRREDT